MKLPTREQLARRRTPPPVIVMRYPRRKKFILCIDRFDALGARVWAVSLDQGWTMHKRVDVEVPMTTVFNGVDAKQPKAYLTGFCRGARLDVTTDTLTLEA